MKISELPEDKIIALAKIIAYPNMKASSIRIAEQDDAEIIITKEKYIPKKVEFVSSGVIVDIFEDFDFRCYYKGYETSMGDAISTKAIVKAYQFAKENGVEIEL